MSIPTFTRQYRLPLNGGVKSLSLHTAPVAPPEHTEVLVKIHAVSLNYRELMIANGLYPAKLKDDLVPGSDMAGEVLAVGPKVTKWKVGDRVTSSFALNFISGDGSPEVFATCLGAEIDGVQTEYRSFPEHSLVKIPDELTYEEASTFACAGVTAYNALLGTSPPLRGGETVLVQGTGGVAIFSLQIAVASGATVIITSSSDQKLEVAKKLGAKHLINYKKTPDWEKEVLKITNGRGVDRVIDFGGNSTLHKSATAVRMAGHVALVGMLATGGDISSLPVTAIMKGLTLKGVAIGSRTQLEQLFALVEATDLKPVIDNVFELEQLKEALEYLESAAHVGKVVLRIAKN